METESATSPKAIAGAVLLALVVAALLRGSHLASKPLREILGAAVPSKVLLVVAHPDDEAMFFWPTLSRLAADGVPLSVLCLSTGDADGLGKVRLEEMRASCARLGVVASSLRVLDEPELRDGFHSWPEEVVASHVVSFVKEQKAQLLLSFDDRGVSGHPNHISASQGVLLAQEMLSQKAVNVTVLQLDSIPLLAKYVGPLSLSWLPGPGMGRATFVSLDPTKSLRALALHWSQLVWYRVLFTVFSRYTYINTYTLKQ